MPGLLTVLCSRHLDHRASDMILAAHSDASYLSETNARSRAGGHFFLSKNDHYPNNNGAVLTIAQIIKAVMSLAAEAKLMACYTSMHEKSYHCVTSSLKWAIHNHPLPYKQTTPQPWVLSTTPSNQNVLRPWTCIFTGCTATLTKNIFGRTGVLVLPT